ncbi:hypothetical protein [Thomasclavelia cocleata]|uniref:hypothetical protein n=1 Tax=Thomasclavelia cocleata TaxID=69824 RepID=UPI00249430DD|nr:hypothetical protein [Thomasclavelia cocleata]
MTISDIDKATREAHQLVVYEESEQSDIKVDENKFDALWQSIYDVCSLVRFGILKELLSEEEYIEGIEWLKKYQNLTTEYKEKELEF